MIDENEFNKLFMVKSQAKDFPDDVEWVEKHNIRRQSIPYETMPAVSSNFGWLMWQFAFKTI